MNAMVYVKAKYPNIWNEMSGHHKSVVIGLMNESFSLAFEEVESNANKVTLEGGIEAYTISKKDLDKLKHNN